MLSFFPQGVLDEILNLIESVSEGFLSTLRNCLKFLANALKAIQFYNAMVNETWTADRKWSRVLCI